MKETKASLFATVTEPDPQFMHPSDQSGSIVHGGCCVRFDEQSPSGNTAPRLYVNHKHAAVGIVSVGIDWSDDDRPLKIITDNNLAIIAPHATPDETLLGRKISFGPSGGSPETRFYVHQNGVRIPAWSPALFGEYANVWLSWIWKGLL